MIRKHDISVTEDAVRQGRQCGLMGDIEARVIGLAARSMPSNHPAGNRVYGPYVLHMRGSTVVSVTLVGPRPVDARPVSECKLCHGMMSLPCRVTINGAEGIAHRPCPRAFDASQPLCDTKTTTTKET